MLLLIRVTALTSNAIQEDVTHVNFGSASLQLISCPLALDIGGDEDGDCAPGGRKKFNIYKRE